MDWKYFPIFNFNIFSISSVFLYFKTKNPGFRNFFLVDNAGMNHSPPKQRLSKSDTAEVSRPFFLAALFLV
jgi:hypothetical protein